MLPPAFNLHAWIDQHRHLLKPPVGNKVIYDGDFIVMVVGGPNARTDYHWDEGPEWFYQLEGEMVLRIQEDGAVRDIPIRAGETFLLPPRVPHSPQRGPDTIGLVVERRRPQGEPEHLIFFCEKCNTLVYDKVFDCKDIVHHFARERVMRSRCRGSRLKSRSASRDEGFADMGREQRLRRCIGAWRPSLSTQIN